VSVVPAITDRGAPSSAPSLASSPRGPRRRRHARHHHRSCRPWRSSLRLSLNSHAAQ
jgi:hypothetical protein